MGDQTGISDLSTLWQDPKVNSLLCPFFLGYLPRTGEPFVLSDKGSPALKFFFSFKNVLKYFVEVGFLRWKGLLSPSGSLVKLSIVWVNLPECSLGDLNQQLLFPNCFIFVELLPSVRLSNNIKFKRWHFAFILSK